MSTSPSTVGIRQGDFKRLLYHTVGILKSHLMQITVRLITIKGRFTIILVDQQLQEVIIGSFALAGMALGRVF